jgi:hypothetical protein
MNVKLNSYGYLTVAIRGCYYTAYRRPALTLRPAMWFNPRRSPNLDLHAGALQTVPWCGSAEISDKRQSLYQWTWALWG